MVGMGEANFPALLLALGKSPSVAGLVGSVPLLAGACLQLVTPGLLARLGSHRAWVVTCAVMQALALAVLAMASWKGSIETPVAFAIVAVYFASSQASGAGWNGWIECLVPARIRPRYFANRNRMLQASLLGALVLSGYLLDWHVTFTGVLAIAVVARLASAFALSRHPDLPTHAAMSRGLSMREFVQRLAVREDGRVMRYVLASQVAVYFAAPFFAPYMLRGLKLQYGAYVVLSAAIYLGRICIYPVCARVLKRHGSMTLLWIGGVAITLLPLPWIFTTDYTTLLVVQVLSGFAWGTFETATFFLYLETIPSNERAAMMSAFNLCNALAVVLGATLGGSLLAALGSGDSAYFVVFAVSTVLRLAGLVVLRGVAPTPQVLAPALVQRFSPLRPRLRRPRVTRVPGGRPPNDRAHPGLAS